MFDELSKIRSSTHMDIMSTEKGALTITSSLNNKLTNEIHHVNQLMNRKCCLNEIMIFREEKAIQ